MTDIPSIFSDGRSHAHWLDQPLAHDTLQAIYDTARLGPTSMNCSPARIVFVLTPEAKQRLLPALNAGNVDKVMAAPVTAIIAYDTQFYELMPQLFPHRDVRAMFADNAALCASTALRNSSLQGGYLMMAARAHGVDCGPMSGFDAAEVDQEFFPDGRWRVNFLCNLGYGDSTRLAPRLPRLSFREACSVV